jgi:hypothetical protein
MEKVCRTFSVEAGLRTIFEYPTIQQLAQWIAASNPLQTQPDSIPYVGERAFYVASAAQERLYFEQLLNRDRLTANISFGYAINGEPDPDRIDHALRMLLDRHAGLRTGFQFTEDGVVQVIDSQAELAVTELDAARRGVLGLRATFRSVQAAAYAVRAPAAPYAGKIYVRGYSPYRMRWRFAEYPDE